jgi:hypothetical protein
MSEVAKTLQPEFIDSKTIDGIVTTVTVAIDKYGEGQIADIISGQTMIKSGTFLVRNHELDDLDPSKIPSLSVNIPVGDFAEGAAFRAELGFGYQDSTLSNQVLVNKDGTF